MKADKPFLFVLLDLMLIVLFSYLNHDYNNITEMKFIENFYLLKYQKLILRYQNKVD